MSSFATKKSSTRFEGTVTVASQFMGPLIGYRGSNIRRITAAVKFGTHIRGMEDGVTFKISSWNKDALKKAAYMIKQDEAALQDPNRKSSKPSRSLVMEPEYVPHVVGAEGIGLKTIMQKIGDGCYIVHRDGAFVVTANSRDDVDRACSLLLRDKRDYIAHLRSLRPPSPIAEKPSALQLSNTFDALGSDSDDESDDDHIDVHFPQLNPGASNISLKIQDNSWTSQGVAAIHDNSTKAVKELPKKPVVPLKTGPLVQTVDLTLNWGDMVSSDEEDSDSDCED